ncbi:MAG: hypothetical protein AAFX81_01000 [Pseudomonadota bacterium]
MTGAGRCRSRVAAVVLAAALVSFGLATPMVSAQTAADAPATEAELDRLFEQMLADPADLDLAFRYAQLAVVLGDYEAAVGALERMLVINPDLPRVRLELGALYFRLEAYGVARVYLEEAVAGDDVPETVQRRVAELLSEIDRRTSRHRYSGRLFGGGRYQTNANSGPSGPFITLGGVDVLLGNDATGEPDVNAFGLFEGTYSYDLQNQAGDLLEVNGLGFGTLYAKRDELNLLIANVDVGPRIQLGRRGVTGVNVRPYLLGSYVSLDRRTYYSSFGAGANVQIQPSERTAFELTYEFRRDDFIADSARPFADLRDADLQAGFGVVRYAFTPRIVGEASVGIADNSADAEFRSFNDYAGNAVVTVALDAPFEGWNHPWYASVSGGVRRTKYDGVDPFLRFISFGDIDFPRRDDEWRVGGSLTAGITSDLGLIGRLDYRKVNSNIDLYDFDNLSATLGLSWRF